MLIIFYFLLMLRVGRGSDGLIFETKVVSAGDDVTLTCESQEYSFSSQLFWIRLVSGNFPEVLRGSFSPNPDKNTRNTTKSEAGGTLTLHIRQSTRRDSGVYYCFQVNIFELNFLKGAFLRIKGSEPEVTAIIQEPPSGPVHPGSLETLMCSVHYDSENKPCPGDHMVFWFRAGSQESHPSVLYADGNSCDGSVSPQRCSYTSSRTISSSDAGTYYCAVASCGEILFGNGTKVDVQQASSMSDLQNLFLILLSAALSTSLMFNVCLIYIIKKRTLGCSSDAAAASGDQQQRDQNSLVYSAPTFTKRKPGRAETRRVKSSEGESLYSDIRLPAKD